MLRDKIEEKRKYATTLTTLYVVLLDYINCIDAGQGNRGLLMNEISSRYKEIAIRYNVREKFYPSYIQRQTGEDKLFYQNDRRFVLNDSLVNTCDRRTLEGLAELIVQYLSQRNDLYNDFFQELNDVFEANDINISREFIYSLFIESRFGNFGQVFEVLAYSILKVYFDSFGFTLKRFSVSFSNDGGMDYISSNGIYQVTASPSSSKITGDLEKLPGTSRVMVLSECTDQIINECLDSENVTEVITADDLKYHFIQWMFKRDIFRTRLLPQVLITIREEMLRETR